VIINVITLFEEEFRQMLSAGVTGSAVKTGKVQLKTWNPRDYASDRHRTVDDRPYGGGPGMVMKVEPLLAAISAVRSEAEAGTPLSLMSPQGVQLDQAAVRGLAQRKELILLCGRYEGIDERLIELAVDEEWSIGDYVLSGGELAAAVISDAVIRLQPGVLGDETSSSQDSYSTGLLDYQHYTRPELIEGLAVPPVLLSGDHNAIDRWRKMQSLGRTWERRPDLLDVEQMDDDLKALLSQYQREKRNKNQGRDPE
jgi:tRNA (guanine37-N1)-methyltransferase